MSLDRLKEISLFEGKSLDEIFNVIFKQSLEEREEANRPKSKKFPCECGKFYTKGHEKRHKDSPLHKRLMAKLMTVASI